MAPSADRSKRARTMAHPVFQRQAFISFGFQVSPEVDLCGTPKEHKREAPRLGFIVIPDQLYPFTWWRVAPQRYCTRAVMLHRDPVSASLEGPKDQRSCRYHHNQRTQSDKQPQAWLAVRRGLGVGTLGRALQHSKADLGTVLRHSGASVTRRSRRSNALPIRSHGCRGDLRPMDLNCLPSRLL
jgi:hypothetical protein